MYTSKPPLGTQLDWSNPLNKGLVMHLAMNEGHGDHLQDLSMYGNHGTMNGFAYPPTAASGWNPGQTGVGVNFDGTDDYVNCGNHASLDITDEIMISAWVKPTIIEKNDFIWGGSQTSKGYSLRIHNSDSTKLEFYIGDGVTYHQFQYTHNMSLCSWHHIVGKYDGNTGTIYVDGIEIGHTDNAFTPNGSHTGIYLIGADGAGLNQFPGSIDQVRIQNRAWSAKEVLDYYINPYQVYLDEDD